LRLVPLDFFAAGNQTILTKAEPGARLGELLIANLIKKSPCRRGLIERRVVRPT
jgi:hypothetical protein